MEDVVLMASIIPSILRGMVKCAASGRTVSCDLKKGKFIYLIARDPANPEKKIWIREETVLAQVRDVIQSLHIPDDLLADIVDYMRQTHEAEKVHHQENIKRLNTESAELTQKLDRLTDCLLDQSITKDMYSKKHQAMTQRQFEITNLLKNHHAADGQFKNRFIHAGLSGGPCRRSF
jgi:site-specific DNA recombinase